MWRRVCTLVMLAGCWSDDPLIDGALTADQLAHFRDVMKRPPLDTCALHAGQLDAMTCDRAARLGQELFFEPSLSTTMGSNGSTVYGTVSCITCHDPKAYFVDTRWPNNVSQKAVGFTKRNAPTTVDVATKFEASTTPLVFTWVGQFDSAGAVLDLAARKAMDVSHAQIAVNVRRSAYYANELESVFPGRAGVASDCDTPDHPEDVDYCKLMTVFEAYMFRLNTTSPFDRYMLGDDSALSDDEKRGFGVFVGRGTCVECHEGPALTDDAVHVTGVAQEGPHVVPDAGRVEVSMFTADQGAFLTASLRNVAKTAPYMHDGSLATLADVIAFYRRGGDADGYTGTKDPRIVPLDLTDADARDLEAFLRALTGSAIDPALENDIRPLKCAPGLTSCGMYCASIETDPSSCGYCGWTCMPGQACTKGACVDAGGCAAPLLRCGSDCIDQASDPHNCGGCGVSCPADQVCSFGHCTTTECPAGTTACGDQCTDLSNDPYNCGACNAFCMGHCVAGQCK